MKNVGILLPNGNRHEIPLIVDELTKRYIDFNLSAAHGAYIFRIPETQISKLPKDKKGHYIPVEEGSGHGYYEIRDDFEKGLVKHE